MAGTALGELLFDRVAADGTLDDTEKEIVLAAFDGDDALAGALGDGADRPPDPTTEAPAGDRPGGVFVRSIRVHGFRGIGPASTLDLAPGPGLTVVTGRNGSGKSSYAEAAELALTGTSSRWDAKANNRRLWQEGWRNLHAGSGTEIEVELVATGQPPTTVRMAWAPGAGVEDRRWTRQDAGAKRIELTSAWPDDRGLYRPFLSYGELGALIDSRPTELHDALHNVLGLEALDQALSRLKAHRSELSGRATRLREDKKTVLDLLATVEDERARRAGALLAPQRPDLAALAELALGTDPDSTGLDRLRAVRALAAPGFGEVQDAATAIGTALADVDRAATADATTARAMARLLTDAIAFHDAHGDSACPVCGTGTLDRAWRGRSEAALARAEEREQQLRSARTGLSAALDRARSLVAPVPAVLRNPPQGLDATAALDAWDAWAAAGRADDPVVLAVGLAETHPNLVTALQQLRAQAATELDRLDEAWRPVASRLIAWQDEAGRVGEEAARLGALKRAETWLKAAAGALRNERMAPFSARSCQIWQQLRQESNVDLGGVQLLGTSNHRKAVLDVTVDGSQSSALSVMSQGELHALGLSLFLPRATCDDSPFRFVMIDDPVQAMDPAKVDGLARVLSDLARTRQVVVFSHDDRLAEAVRRLPDPATVLAVHRGERSVVQVVPVLDPVRRYLDDARMIVRTRHLPENLRGELVATCCRSALEAAAHAKVRAVRLTRGDRHLDVETALAEADTTTDKLRLAVFDDSSRQRNDLYDHLDRRTGAWASRVVRATTKGAHKGYTGVLDNLIADARRLAEWVQR